MSEIDIDEYGDLRHGAETDITYRIRDDGNFVALFGPRGDRFIVGVRAEDVEKINSDLE